jgi:hypothetical protein
MAKHRRDRSRPHAAAPRNGDEGRRSRPNERLQLELVDQQRGEDEAERRRAGVAANVIADDARLDVLRDAGRRGEMPT